MKKITLWFAGAAMLQAWVEPSVWDGIFTADQAQRGLAIYGKECASCHRDNLHGHGQTPSLSGAEFLEKWDGQMLGDLFEKMQTSMPADHPGRLTREQNAAVLAYVLQVNEFPSGGAELRTDSDWLGKVRFLAKKP